MEITQHANTTLNALLMKHAAALTPKRVFPKPVDLERCASSCVQMTTPPR